MTVITGLDIGNGYLKGRFQGIKKAPLNIDIPSCAALLPSTYASLVQDEPNDEFMADIFNRIVCKFHSKLVDTNDRMFKIGQGAIELGRSLIEFEISDNAESKAEQELSSILTLASIAGAAVANYWTKNARLPTSISLNVRAALALPIEEFSSYKEKYKSKFMASDHEVVIYNFEKPIRIMIHFDYVGILPEGVSAQFAISARGEAFIQALLDDIRKRDKKALPGITAKDIRQCKNTLGIDIGEGTVNFPVVTNGRFNSVLSHSLKQGYGSVLEQSLPAIRNANLPFTNRKSIVDYLQTKIEDNKFQVKRKEKLLNIITLESEYLVDDIIREVSRLLSKGGAEIIYVYGGGATPLKHILYNELVKKTQAFANGDIFPILYLDSSYARHLNREGLYQLALSESKKIPPTPNRRPTDGTSNTNANARKPK